MNRPNPKTAQTDDAMSYVEPTLQRSFRNWQYGAIMMFWMTLLITASGFSIALEIYPDAVVICATLACFGISSVLYHPSSRKSAPISDDTAHAEQSPSGQRPMQITLHTPDTIYSPRHIPSWCALACAAGAVNGFAFLACEEFVSHVTGTSTQIGLEWHHLGLAIEYALVLGCFIGGAIASVLWLQARAYRGKRPRWATPLRAVALILVGAAIAGHNGYFSPLGGEISEEPPFVLLSVLAFAMGLQNAAVATTTGLSVRTTHLTGPSTDLGVHLGTAYFANGSERKEAFKGAALRAGKIAAFVFGAGLAVPLEQELGYLALLAPASRISFAAALSFLPDWSPSDFPFRRQLANSR